MKELRPPNIVNVLISQGGNGLDS